MQIRRRFITMTTLCMMTFSLTCAPLRTGAEEGSSMGFSLCNGFVYVYSDMDRNSEIVGKLYTDSYVDILEECEYDWTHISSGNVNGYVDSTAIKKGKKARKIAKQVGYTTAVVQVDELLVRAKKRENADVLAVVNQGDVLEVVKQGDEWVKVVLVGEEGDLIYGWVSSQYVSLNTEYRLAVTMEEDELGLIDIGEEETESELEEGDDEEIYDDDGGETYYEEPEPTYQEPAYTEPSPTYTQPETQAQTQAPSTEAAQPQTQAPTEAPQPETQADTEAPAPSDDGGSDDEIYEDPGAGDDTVVEDPGDEVYEDDGSGDEVYDDEIFDDEFYDAG